MSVFRIVVRDELSSLLVEEFPELRVEPGSGATILTGEIADQAQLHGILERLGSWGLELIAVEQVGSGPRAA